MSVPKLAWALAGIALAVGGGCAGGLAPGTATPRADGTQDVVVLLINKGAAPAADATIYVDDSLVARSACAPWPAAEAPRLHVRLSPGVHRMRVEFAGVTSAVEVQVDAGAENVWHVVYTDKPQDLGSTVVPAGVLIERIRPC